MNSTSHSSPGDDTSQESGPERYATRDQLRAMAHPARLEIMERVGRRGTARAADIAADMSMPANSVSYHLRILARGGVIEEASEAARDRRDRVWRLAQDSFEHGRDTGPDNDPGSVDGEYVTAAGAMSLAAFDWVRSAWSAEIARHSALTSRPEDGLGAMFATSMRLSEDQMRELNRLVTSTVQEYHQKNRDGHGADVPGDPDSDGDALPYRVLWATVGEQSVERDEPSQKGGG